MQELRCVKEMHLKVFIKYYYHYNVFYIYEKFLFFIFTWVSSFGRISSILKIYTWKHFIHEELNPFQHWGN